MNLTFDIDPEIFHERKRRRISAMNNQESVPPKPAPTSMPGIHEIAGFLPGRLEFEHELDNEAEDLVKDLEFGFVSDFGGEDMMEDENDPDVKARQKWEEDKRSAIVLDQRAGSLPIVNGFHANGDMKKLKTEDVGVNVDDDADEPTQPQPYETHDSIAFKLTLLESYFQRVDKRHEAKALIFERGLLDYKKAYFSFGFCTCVPLIYKTQMQAAEKKRPREEREFLHRLRPFARLQTAEDYEAFSTDMLRKHFLTSFLFLLNTEQTRQCCAKRYKSSNNIAALDCRPLRISINMK